MKYDVLSSIIVNNLQFFQFEWQKKVAVTQSV